MRAFFPLTCLLVLAACTGSPPEQDASTQTRPINAPTTVENSPAQTATPPMGDPVAVPASTPSPDGQALADRYLRQALEAAQQRYDKANAHCPEQPVPDDCVSSATAALEQEQAAARLEHQRQLQELHQGG